MSKPKPFSVLSSVHGAIKQLLMVYESSEVFQSILMELVQKLSHHTQVILWVDDDAKKTEAITCLYKVLPKASVMDCSKTVYDSKKMEKAKCVVVVPPKGEPVSFKWVRDPFIVFQNTEKEVQLVESCTQEFNSYLAEFLKGQGIITEVKKVEHIRESCWLTVAGGNILVDEEFILIGDTSFTKMKRLLQNSFPNINNKASMEDLMKNLFHKLFNDSIDEIRKPKKKIIFIRNEDTGFCNKHKLKNVNSKDVFNPRWWWKRNSMLKGLPSNFAHIDMFISLTGEHLEIKDKDGQVVKRKNIVLLAKPTALYPANSADANELECLLTDIALTLEDVHDFVVLRNPVPLISQNPEDASYYIGLYNNCLIERISATNKIVWLPTYGMEEKWKSSLQVYDQINRNFWEQLGYKVIMIEANFHEYAIGRGALHCISNELIRDIIDNPLMLKKMAECKLGTEYPIGGISGGTFKFERDILLSNDRKRILIKKFNPPNANKNGSPITECERSIENGGIGVKATAHNNLVFSTPHPPEKCGMTIRVQAIGNRSPSIELLKPSNDVYLSFIGIEDIRIGRGDTRVSIQIQNGFNIEYTELNGVPYIILQIWQVA